MKPMRIIKHNMCYEVNKKEKKKTIVNNKKKAFLLKKLLFIEFNVMCLL